MIRAFQRTSNHDIMTYRKEATPQKMRERQNLTFQRQLRVSKFLTFIHFLQTFRLQVALENFLWVI